MHFRAFTKYLGTIEELKQMPIDQIPREEGIVIQSKPHVINEGNLYSACYANKNTSKEIP